MGRPPLSGTVSFLFTDIVDSTVLWDRFPRAMADALARHDTVVRAAIADHGGVVFSGGGDGFGAAFARAEDALGAACTAQLLLSTESWPDQVELQVRMGLHTGAAQERDGNYFGTVNRAARVSAAANGGQVLVSSTVAALVADGAWSLVDVGEHRLRGLVRSERLYRVQTDGMPDVALPVRAVPEHVGNLPRRRVELIGRQREVERLGTLLAPGTLVTVSGPGGVGKTRLALAVAAGTAGSFADGGWLVELAAATTPDDVLSVVVAALGLMVGENPVTAHSVARALGDQQRLVVVDNCEHVIESARILVDAILAHCPSVALLATSREVLGCDGERLFALPPLAVDSVGEPSGAAALFVARVDGLLGGFAPDGDDQMAIDEICRRVDGLPLALELAAARVGALGLQEVRSRLAGRIDSLGRRRGGDERHHSLTETVAWSYELLSPDEQQVFERLSVFPDGFDLAAVDAVRGFPSVSGSVEDHLVSLIDKSLVVVQRSTPVRYRQLEMIRQYGEDRLRARDESETTADRLLAYYVGWVAEADAGTRGPDELRWHRAFQAEWNNLRSAINRAVAIGDLDAACQIVWHARWWAVMRLQLELGEWADAVLNMPGADLHPLIPIVGVVSGACARHQSHWSKSRQRLAEAEHREKKIGEAPEPWVPNERSLHETLAHGAVELPSVAEIRRRAAGSLFWVMTAAYNDALGPAIVLASASAADDQDSEHLRRIRRCVELAESLGNPTCMARAANLQGTAVRRTEPHQALALLEGSLAVVESAGSISAEGENRLDLGHLYVELNRPRDALEMLASSIRQYRRAGAWAKSWDMTMAAFPALVALGESQVACLIVGGMRDAEALDAVWKEYFFPARLVAQLEQEMGATEMRRALDDGARMPSTAITQQVLDTFETLNGDPAAGG